MMLNRERVFFILITVACVFILKPLLLPLATGMIFAFLCEEPVNRLIRRWNVQGKRSLWLLAFGFVTVVQGLFITPLVLLTWSAATEVLKFWNGVSQEDSAVETAYRVLSWVDKVVTPWLQHVGFNISIFEVQSKLRGFAEPLLKNLVGYVGNIVSATPELIMFLIVTWMAWVYFLIHGRAQRRALLPRLIPWDEQRKLLAGTLAEVLRAMVLTSIVLSLVQSALVLVTLGIVGIPKFYLWGALSFFLSFVPVFGTAPVMISAAVFSFYQDRPFAGAFILGMAVAIGLVDNILRPLLMKGSTEMSFFWLFLALVGGISMFGLPGAVLGPWVFSIFIALQAASVKSVHPEVNEAHDAPRS